MAPMLEAPADFHQTVFPIEGEDPSTDSVLGAASKLADKLRAKRAYTNTATFDLRCEVSGLGIIYYQNLSANVCIRDRCAR